MEKAIQMVREGKASARGAAVQCNVPRSTLWDRLVGRVTHGVDRRRKKLKKADDAPPNPARFEYSCGMWVPSEEEAMSSPSTRAAKSPPQQNMAMTQEDTAERFLAIRRTLSHYTNLGGSEFGKNPPG